uniref:HEAT repeat containing 4 n=1 Tax=Latimeria chalumnae TaxID=7897 RepID=H3AUC9_LATCH|nr:PREDICTED: HEAT repeat-containing protein 4 isoform X1 [Latimeria chalumnae]|eukprot:XP_014349242.1 PREDICTED: HEAT repeat-containing protein 4 isoform X1 [Latimeria chalumnae]
MSLLTRLMNVQSTMKTPGFSTGTPPNPLETGVQMSGVAAVGKTELKLPHLPFLQKNFFLSKKRKKRLQKQYLKDTAGDITFSQDVIADRGVPSLLYKNCNVWKAYDASDVVGAPKCKVQPPRKQATPKHFPCHLKPKIQKSPRTQEDEPNLIKTDWELNQNVPSTSELTSVYPIISCSSLLNVSEKWRIPLTKQFREEYEAIVQVPQRQALEWEELTIRKLSKSTAQLLLSQHTVSEPVHSKLQGLLQKSYSLSSAADLEDEPVNKTDCESYKEPEQLTKESCNTVEKTETLLPDYYRVPGYCTQQTWENEPASINRTAANLTVKHLEPLPPLKLQDLLNPKAGKSIYATENLFEQELYSGTSKVVHQPEAKQKDTIVMSNHNEYWKHLQQLFPRTPEEWGKEKQKNMRGVQRPQKGVCRWTALPSQTDYTAELGLSLKPTSSKMETRMDRAGKEYQPREDLPFLRFMVEEWRKAWKLSTRWQSVTIEGLKRDFASQHYHIRVNAIATCASGAMNRPMIEQNTSKRDLEMATTRRTLPDVLDVPEELQPLIVEALNDHNNRVQIAAALCLYAMRKENRKAQEIMQDTLLHGNDADSWAAAQCLALNGDTSFPLIKRIVTELFESREKATKDQASLLLQQLSEATPLAHFLLADELNSRNWKRKSLACKALSLLKGHISKDLTNKLAHLMWNDLNNSVRQAAAQALGKLGLGKEVHNELRIKLEEWKPQIRLEALFLIRQLGIMTAKLMPGFLQCFSDDFVAVRRAACLTAATLKIKDNMVLKQLMHLMQNDPIWKIKAHAIKALGEIGHVTPQLKELFIWAIHYEEEPGILSEVFNSILQLDLKDPEVQKVLQDRVFVESHPLVRSELMKTLKSLGFDTTGNQETIQTITQQVSRLCTKDIITKKLLKLEEMEERIRDQIRLIDLRNQPETLETFTNPELLLELYFSPQTCVSTMMSSLAPAIESNDTYDAEIQNILNKPSCSSRSWTQCSMTSSAYDCESADAKKPVTRDSLNSTQSKDEGQESHG